MEATILLKKIISKGGMIGASGKNYVYDETLASQYILECSKQLHSQTIKTLWGNKLVKQITAYALKFS